MEYIINETITYNSLNGTLFSPDNSVDMITLTRISNELLLLFVQNVRVLLNRDTILNELWEKRGLTASSNNLNNHVSILRKALAECGCSAVITTVPKQGFLFDADIIAIEPTPPTVSEIVVVEHKPLVNDAAVMPAKIVKRRKISPASWKLLAVTGLVLAASLGYAVYDYLRINTIRTEVFRINQCRFYLIDDLSRRMETDWIIERIKAIVSDEKINCELQANVYYSADKKLDSRGNPTLHEFLSYCPYNSKAPCENYMLTRTEGNNEKNNH